MCMSCYIIDTYKNREWKYPSALLIVKNLILITKLTMLHKLDSNSSTDLIARQLVWKLVLTH